MTIHRTHRSIRLASCILGATLLASCSPSPRAAPVPQLSEEECQTVEAERLAKLGFRPGADLDSLREARLDSAAAWFLEPRMSDVDTTVRLDREPELLDARSLRRLMNQYYPPKLRHQGIGGTTVVVFFSPPDSTPTKIRVIRSSGSGELDLASVRVIQASRVAPGVYHGCPLWIPIAIPITWQSPWPRR
jgi:TonB family protein